MNVMVPHQTLTDFTPSFFKISWHWQDWLFFRRLPFLTIAFAMTLTEIV